MKTAKIKDLFEVKYGINLELVNLEECKKNEENTINFVSRSEKNNGISAIVRKVDLIKSNPANTISVAGGGSVLSTFLQKEEYYSGRDVYVLVPRRDFTEFELLFYAYTIRCNKYRFNYGRQANRTLPDISIPVEVPQSWKKSKASDFNILDRSAIDVNQVTLDMDRWKLFNLKDIFKFEKCKCNSATDLLEKGKDINYIGAKKTLNGFMQKVKNVPQLVSHGNCIVFIGDGQGSVGFSIYQPDNFIGSTTLTCGYNKELNKYNALFITTVLDRERCKYSFGRKYGKEQLLRSKIKLPSKGDQPDWSFMKKYIQTLPYSSSL